MIAKIRRALDGDVAGKVIAVPRSSRSNRKPMTCAKPRLFRLFRRSSMRARGSGRRIRRASPRPGPSCPGSVEYVADVYETLDGADAVVLLTEWNVFRGLDLTEVKRRMRGNVFIDLRNVYEPDPMRKMGFEYTCVGRGRDGGPPLVRSTWRVIGVGTSRTGSGRTGRDCGPRRRRSSGEWRVAVVRHTIRKAVFPVGMDWAPASLPATKALAKEIAPRCRQAISSSMAVEEAIAAGITHLVFVTGHTKKAIEDHFDRSAELESTAGGEGKDGTAAARAVDSARVTRRACTSGSRQPLGLGHAVWCARPAIGDEPFRNPAPPMT